MSSGTRNRNYAATGAPMDAISSDDIEMESSSSLEGKRARGIVTEHENSAVEVLRRFARNLFHKDQLDRSLYRPHIVAIAFSGTVGMGIYVTTGELIGIAGSLGCVIAWVGAGIIIIPVMRCLAEMVSVRPVSGALVDYPHTYVDEALGFAVGVTYWLAQCISMATLTAAAARAADNFFENEGISREGLIGIIIGLYLVTLFSNLCGVQLYGQIERVVMWFKFFLLIGLCTLMILIKAGVRGPQEMDTSTDTAYGLVTRSEDGYGNNSIVPFLRWNGFKGPEDLIDGGYKTGISHSWGQFLAIGTSITLAMFSCMGGDIVIVAAGEAKYRRDLPPVTRFMYLVPIGFYIVAAFLIGLNINFMDPNLCHPWAKPAMDGPHISCSPFILAISHASIKVLPKFINACILISAYTTGNTGLYVSSRTLMTISQLYGNSWIKGTFGRTNNGNTPVAAILFCSLFGFLAFLGLVDSTFNQPILTLASFFTGAVGCIYASECIAYLRFKSGLSQLAQSVLDRDSDYYQKEHYRAHWQPLCAIFGLCASIVVTVFSGWPAIYLLIARDSLSTASTIKDSALLAADVIGSYSGPVIFLTLFFGYKIYHRTQFRQFRDFEDTYFLPEFDGQPQRKKQGLVREILSFFIIDRDRERERERSTTWATGV